MKLAAMEYLVAGRDDTATFAKAKRLGFEGVEVLVRRQELRAPGRPRLRDLKRAATATGLAIPSLVLIDHNNGGIASGDAKVDTEAREEIRLCIEWAAELGATVILVPFFGDGEIIGEAAFERAAAGFRELCGPAQARGVRLCYEGTHSAGDIRRMAEKVGSPAFGCYFDLANVVWRGMDTATEIRALRELVAQVHMKDTRVGPGDCRPGLGRVDYAESARALREIGYDGWLVMETPGGPFELVQRDMSFTRTVFPQLPAGEPWPRLGAFSYGFQTGERSRLIESFRKAGLACVQVGSEVLDEAFADPEALRSELEANGLVVAGIAAYRNLVAPDPKKRRANLDHLKRCLGIAPRLGTSVVATETGTLHPESDWTATPENWSAAAWDALHAALDELLPVAEKHGSLLTLEGYVNNVLATHGQLLGLLEKYPTQHLQVMLDPFNYLSKPLLPARERITSDFLDRFEPRFVLAHLKDVAAEGAEVNTPEFGTGVFPHKLYLDFLRKRRPDLPLILEHLPFERIPSAIQRLRGLCGV
jgi:sugar phosphate isomerase/epimerase